VRSWNGIQNGVIPDTMHDNRGINLAVRRGPSLSWDTTSRAVVTEITWMTLCVKGRLSYNTHTVGDLLMK
jgi:hypothetical protein